MKSHSAKLQNSSTTPNSYAKKIATMCAMHGIPSGAGGNLGTFMRALDEDKLLALNFWSLVVKISDLENGSNVALLEAISQGVTGKSVAEAEAAGGEQQWLIKQMACMLAGEDIHIPAAASLTPVASAEPVRVEVPVVAVEAQTLVLAPPSIGEALVAAEAQLQPFLIRDDRDRSRMVLEPETASSKSLMGQRALFGPEVRGEKTRTIRVPLEGYGERSVSGSARIIAFAVVIAVAAGGAAFFGSGEGAAMQKKLGPSVRARYDSAWRGVKALGGWNE